MKYKELKGKPTGIQQEFKRISLESLESLEIQNRKGNQQEPKQFHRNLQEKTRNQKDVKMKSFEMKRC